MNFLTEIERDSLCELFNISLGGAAKLMSEMISDEILLTVPSLKLISTEEAKNIEYLANQEVCTIEQKFIGGIGEGSAFLLFHKSASLEIVKMMMKDYVALNEVSQFEKDALSEIGNIILNAILSNLAKMSDYKIETHIPEFFAGKYEDLLLRRNPKKDNSILLVFIDYKLSGKDIKGYIFFILNFESIKNLSRVLIEKLKQ
ncbi:chemotaxis protein CheC [Leptospira bourretii]|uniref:Chemotaxis protein CheC n=1 Tax=Leptospira bourretii TaxID=2484962 RepID=A0A4R9INW5_9LEPT|nr:MULTISPECIES: chemotaxis protein CheX [Leptospira]MCG6140215.1 chemotaxis protein CheX [Leptospira mtsangambouensis]TGK90385.1 chemotaxis protein CheC [Leptospira bourretii]TGK93590.1 chemotaxis protein CheC [Leptospira bourretii]TGL22597.1 chemotaxis protein CheC [Leptospira bourretii]TGL30144.1 chemotaxis protein CheC [Leptospira bourretii]